MGGGGAGSGGGMVQVRGGFWFRWEEWFRSYVYWFSWGGVVAQEESVFRLQVRRGCFFRWERWSR